ncbi:MAG: hypothetical protein COS14_08590 [Bacteroidetes bacterium CG02_land_8_20_14_3_00_31_25]|nr:MAG: hypothetical protein COS14_08590 [Bacteroidetes bacterium CG02_land_8_20_14_3_00_31_25]PIX36280.1 MAG: hypothetical protein COZ59_01965 [Bacteroidetes bacterium CG_4_8_14_3_um_filter_31_14]PIY02431.1 MAG: hypothetical protein COZ21_14190 [Bacteroidetes bacterium CG_4_10_14_3_um_filter_31_20]
MLLPDNIHPENTIYYNGSFVLQSLQNKNVQNLLELYQNVRLKRDISFSLLILCLDWLYLIDVAEINNKGKVELCL